MQIWDTIEENFSVNHKIFNSFILKRKHPKSNIIGDFTVIKSNDWVNLIPVTKDNKIVMIEQYRHGTNDITIEVPGGLIENGENHRLAGQRECTEETGYFSKEDAIYLGKSEPNPAFMNNSMYHYLWKNCELKFEQNLDLFEDIKVVLFTQEEIEEKIKSGIINHSLVLSAFYFKTIRNL